MKHFILMAGYSAMLTACTTAPKPEVDPGNLSNVSTVSASFETPVMASRGDAADDPAIYIGENGQGFVAGTDKQAGLYIYNLDGSEREFMPLGTLNNVDLRDGFIYQRQSHVLLVASNDETNTITTLLYNPDTDTFIQPGGFQLSTGDFSPYGICLGKSVNGTFHAGVTSKAGIYQQYILSESDGKMAMRKAREFSTGTKTEGCVFDDRSRSLYIAEEEGGLYLYPASPSGKDGQTVLARANDYGMKPDLEGVTIYEEGPTDGYLLVSSQGNNSFAAFKLPTHEFSGRFTIKNGDVDAVSTTDGIAATSVPTARFPKGFFVVQDDMDETSPSEAQKKQNFKIVDWRDIEAVLK